MDDFRFPPQLRKIKAIDAPPKVFVMCGLLGAAVSTIAFMLICSTVAEVVDSTNFMLRVRFPNPPEGN